MAEDHKPAPKEKKVKLVLERDFWETEDKRIVAGTVFDVDPMEAIELIEKGLAKRV